MPTVAPNVLESLKVETALCLRFETPDQMANLGR